jgi:hypothetical protein
MNRKELIATLAGKTSGTKASADRNISALIDIFSGALKRGDKITLTGYGVATMTPEFGPDGYLHTLPFTNHPVANLNQINAWMAATERQHFQQWKSVN